MPLSGLHKCNTTAIQEFFLYCSCEEQHSRATQLCSTSFLLYDKIRLNRLQPSPVLILQLCCTCEDVFSVGWFLLLFIVFFYNYGWQDYSFGTMVGIADVVRVMQFELFKGKVAIHCHAGLGMHYIRCTLINCQISLTVNLSASLCAIIIRSMCISTDTSLADGLL